MPDNPGGLVYGAILVATLLAAEITKRENYLKTVGAVVIALLIYWLSISYSEYTGERVERSGHFEYAGFARMAIHEISVLYGAMGPLLVLLICWAAGATLSTGVSIAIWTDVALIVTIEVAIGIRAELTGRDLVRQTAVGVLLGLLVFGLRVLLH